MLTTEDLTDFIGVVADFADHGAAVLFDPRSGDGPDGDLGAIAGLLSDARNLGLLSDPATTAPGTDWGVWRDHVWSEGCDLSLECLVTLGERCAGLAAAVHAHGIGRLASTTPDRSRFPSDRSVAAAFVPAYGIVLDPRAAQGAIQLHRTDGNVILHGRSPFVWSATVPDVLVVAAHDPVESEWSLLACAVDASGVGIVRGERRVGLRATGCHDITFDHVTLCGDAALAESDQARHTLEMMIACDWLGCAGIALGTARAAHRQAVGYATGRRQGGRAIIDHAAVRLLLANAAHHIDSLDALLHRHRATPLDDLSSTDLLSWAISARVGIAEHAVTAVTDSLQTLGGYGYMDDCGLSKRLRDTQTLALRHGGRDQLLLLRHALDSPGDLARWER